MLRCLEWCKAPRPSQHCTRYAPPLTFPSRTTQTREDALRTRMQRLDNHHYSGTTVRPWARRADSFEFRRDRTDDRGAGEVTGPFGVIGLRLLPQRLRDAEGLADRTPDDLGVLAVGERLVDGASTQARHHVVLRDALGISLAELRAHPLPERCQPHGPRLPAARRRQRPAQRKLAAPLGDNRDIYGWYVVVSDGEL